MATPIWIIGPNVLGTIHHGIYFEKYISAIYAITYEVVSGALPLGATIDNNGKISGICYEQNFNSNNPVTNYIFTIRATSSDGSFTDKSFKMSLLSQALLVPAVINQNTVKYQEQAFIYQISRGSVNSDNNEYWRVDQGYMPDGINLYQNGAIEGIIPGFIKPFTLESFLKPEVTEVPDSLIESWNEWARSYLSIIGPNDHQMVLSLRNFVDPIQFSVTARITFIALNGSITWFDDNSEYVQFDPGMIYMFVAVTDRDFITWNSDYELPDLANGEISELSLSARSESGKRLTYALKPSDASFLPLGLFFLNNGLIAGRVGFRTHVDDPNLPVNNDYYFSVRAKTLDNFSFTEKTFKLHINRVHPTPYVNLWIRSFPNASERLYLDSILNNKVFFPDPLMYRINDPWFGKFNELRFLFAPGLRSASVTDYYEAMVNNYSTKEILFGEVTNGYAYDNNLNPIYEVVYLPIVDNFGKLDPVTNSVSGLPDIIDLRPSIKNFYYDKNGVVYYEFTPNGLENMRRQFENKIGYYNQGILPRWMLSPQPIPNKPGQFYPPKGFQSVVVLAYTIPRGSETILYRLKRAGINFNNIRFEFDRLELDDNLTKTFDPSTQNFVGSTETTFDTNQTTFEEGTTRFNRSGDFVGGQGPGVGNKYLKFPRTGAFR
jgi:hypothetical protein